MIEKAKEDVWQYLEAKYPDIKAKVDALIDRYSHVAGTERILLPEYTDHSIGHSKRTIANIYIILGYGKYVEVLSAPELEMLLKAAVIHDIGMIPTKEDKKGITEEEVRETHHLRSRDFIKKKHNELGLGKTEAEYIANIVVAHRTTFDINQVNEEAPISETSYRLRLLASLIRLADELEITGERTSDLLKAVFGIEGDAQIHHRLLEDTVGIQYTSNDDLEIWRRLTFTEETALFAESNKIMQEVFSTVEAILNKYGIPIKRLKFYETLEDPDLEKKEFGIKSALLKGPNAVSVIAAEKGYDEEGIRGIITGLQAIGVIEEENGKITFKKTLPVFRLLAEVFLGKREYEIEFVESEYVRSGIKPLIEKDLKTRFGFGPEEGTEPIEKLLISPTALKWLLFEERVEHLDITFNPESKKGQFYAILIAGFSVDIIYHPLLCSPDNISYFNELTNEVRVSLGDLFDLINEYNEAPKKTPPPGGGNSANILTMSFLKNAAGPDLDIHRLLFASHRAHQKMYAEAIDVLYKSEVPEECFNTPEGAKVSVTLEPPKIEILPSRRRMLCSFTQGRAKDELQLRYYTRYAPRVVATDLFIGEFNFGADKKMNMVLDFPDYISTSYFINQLDILRGLSENRYKYVSIIDDKYNRTVNTSPADSLRLKPPIVPAENEDIYRRLLSLEGDFYIPLPEYLTAAQHDYLKLKRSGGYNEEELLRLKSNSKKAFLRLVLATFDDGILDIQTKRYIPAVLSFGSGIKGDPDVLAWELPGIRSVTPSPKLVELIRSSIDGDLILAELNGSPGINESVTYLKSIMHERIEDGFTTLIDFMVYPPRNSVWFPFQIIDILIIKLIGLSYYLENGRYWLLIRKDYNKAIRYFETADLDYEPNSRYIKSELGWAYFANGDFEKGYGYLKSAERLDVSSEGDTYLFNLALYHVVKGEFDTADSYYFKALSKRNWKQLAELAITDLGDFIERGFISVGIGLKYVKPLNKLTSGRCGRNESCPCGSGIKYKNCHGRV